MSLPDLLDRLIDDIGKGGLSEGTIRSRLTLIRDQAAAMEIQIADLQAQLRNPPPEFQAGRDLSADTEKVLIWFFHSDDVSFEEIQSLGFSPGMAHYHCDVLCEKKMIATGAVGVVTYEGSVGPRFILLPKGREYLVRHKLVS